MLISCVSFLVMRKGEHGGKGEREKKRKERKGEEKENEDDYLTGIKGTNARSGDRMLS